jgi:RNA polymerase sigma-70 factor (ECF subfamily)
LDEAKVSASRTTDTPYSAQADPDTVLVEQYLAGDTHAFEILFAKYQTSIFNLVSRMVNGEDAHDLTQDIFFNALRALKNFRGDSKFSTWLYSIARNVCLNRLRHCSYVKEDSLDQMCEQQSTDLRDHSPGVVSIVETHELQRLVNQVLARLTPEQRMLITLRDFEQLSYEEIGIVMDMQLQTVKSKLHRARLAFKDRFRPYLGMLKEG